MVVSAARVRDPFTIADWGMATLRIGNPFGAGPMAADAKIAEAALQQADATPPKTERERGLRRGDRRLLRALSGRAA